LVERYVQSDSFLHTERDTRVINSPIMAQRFVEVENKYRLCLLKYVKDGCGAFDTAVFSFRFLRIPPGPEKRMNQVTLYGSLLYSRYGIATSNTSQV
jgi:hypothetical protein